MSARTLEQLLPKAHNVAVVEHLVRVMIDDLHVHRLRQVWLHIAGNLGIATAQLEDTKPVGNRLEECGQCGVNRLMPPPPPAVANGASGSAGP
jgi:hypothetical protein